MEVYMDDITVYGGSFEECLINLETVLHRCIEKNLVLNWENAILWSTRELCWDILFPTNELRLTRQKLN